MEQVLKFKTVDEYIAALPAQTKKTFRAFRKTINKAAPGAEEYISYNMPSLKLHGLLLYYAAWKLHIGFYPFPSAIKAFAKELSAYKTAKGSIQFPLDQVIPYELVSKIVAFRVKENMDKLNKKKKNTVR